MAIVENQIRPANLFENYLALAAEDAQWVSERCKWETIDCWACDAPIQKKFSKHHFNFGECTVCKSIIANPRPSAHDISDFYSHGKSPKFWATDFYRVTAEARRELLWKVKARQVAEVIASLSKKPDWVCDIGAGYGIFLEELQKVLPSITVLAIEPTPSLVVELNNKGIRTVTKFLSEVKSSDLPQGTGFFTSFELLEHLQNPLTFLKEVKNLCSKDSAFLATTLSSWGLDIQLLGEKSKSIFPPHHLQILSPKAIRGLSEKAGFKTVSVTTPGKLDLDIAKKSLNQIRDSFWKIFLAESTELDRDKMQELLASAGFSSHMWSLFVNS